MFRRLVINTAVSAVAFFTISLLGLLLTPVLVKSYGLAAFGLIALSRLFLPTGVLSLVDLGISEVGIQIVARARETLDWRKGAAQLSLIGVAGVLLGCVAAVLLGFGASALAKVLKAPPELSEGFVLALQWTAAALPVLFLSLVAEGVLKGFERYDAIRGLEVGGSLLYAGLVLFAVANRQPFEVAALAYVVGQAARASAAIALAGLLLSRANVRPRSWTRDDLRDTAVRSRVLTYGRLLGSLQGQAPPLLISALAGPAAAGVYDVLTRLPRFMKAVLALISSTLVPVAVRLDVANNTEGTRRLGETGLLVVTLATLPTVTACVFFAPEILELWIGPQVSDRWFWLSLMFLQPLVMSIVGFGANMLLGRVDCTRRLNGVTTIQVVLQLGLSLLLATRIAEEEAFIMGQIVAICVTFPLSMNIITSAQGLSRRIYLWLGKGTIVAVALGLVFSQLPRPADLIQLTLYAAAWGATVLAALLALLPSGEERKMLRRIATVLRPGNPGARPGS